MRKRIIAIGLVAALAMIAGAPVRADDSAPPPPAAPAAEQPPVVPAMSVPPAATAPADAPAATPAAPTAAASTPAPAGTATVIFFRPSRFLGAGVGFMVREGQTELGKLRNGKYFVIHVAPGKHEYVVHSESKDVLTMEADAGETYYFLGSVGLGVMVGRPNLAPSDQAAFEEVKAKLTEVAPTDKN